MIKDIAYLTTIKSQIILAWLKNKAMSFIFFLLNQALVAACGV